MVDTTTESWATLATADGPMRAFVTRPEQAGRFPGLVVLQEAFGVNDHIQDVCRRFAARGYVVVSPDLFHRQGAATIPYSEIDQAKKLIAKLDDAQVAVDIQAALGALKADPGVRPGRLGVVGYCFGGRCAYLAATRFPELEAAVVYYGGRIATGELGALVEASGAIDCPVLAHFGAEDASIPPTQVAAVTDALGKAGVDNLVVTYPQAGHGFACDARPKNFHAGAASAAWRLTTGFLQAAFDQDPHPSRSVLDAAEAASHGEYEV